MSCSNTARKKPGLTFYVENRPSPIETAEEHIAEG
jgi:hypothetical protein